jgi:hypothetical protein
LKRSKHIKSWFVKLATGTKRKINEIVKGCPLYMNELNTFVDLDILPLVSYDVLIGMDSLDAHHVVVDCHNKNFTCLYEEEN